MAVRGVPTRAGELAPDVQTVACRKLRKLAASPVVPKSRSMTT
jgi:hypothetical protein